MVDQAEIHRMAQSEDVEERKNATNLLRNNFAVLPDPDKEQAEEDLHQLTKDKDSSVRWSATDALGATFSLVSDKKQAWGDLHRLSQDRSSLVRMSAAGALGVAFSHIPDKNQAWDSLHRLIHDQHNDMMLHNDVRLYAEYSLARAFSHVPDKKQAWDDLFYMTQDEDVYVRWGAAASLGVAFPYNPDKEQAWEDIKLLLQNVDIYVRWGVADTLGVAFTYISDKKEAWNCLHLLTNDKDSGVRQRAASSIGILFPYLPDKKQALNDLHRLIDDHDIDVRVYSNHSLGKAFIFKATEALNEEDFREELEKALRYFESSSKEATHNNPARFCLPFYRSFYTITFRKQEAEEEVKKYLVEAKSAVKGSESKEMLLEAIENLSNALKEMQRAMRMNLEGKKCELNAYRHYCDRATELLKTTEEKAPGATRLVRKGLPIIDEKIKRIIGEIQEKSKILCKQTKGTPLEDLGKEVSRQGQALLQIRDPIGLEKGISYMQITLFAICIKMPEEERGEVCELLKKANEELYIEDKVYLMNIILGKVSSQLSFQTILEDFKSELKARFDKIEKNIDDIAHGDEVTRDLLIGYANRTQGIFHGLLDDSKNCESKTQKLLKESFEEMIKNLEKRDERWLEKLKDELIKKETEIEKELSSVPEIKSKWHKWIDYIKNKAEKETKEILQKLPTEAVVLISTEKILEYGVPFLSAAMSSSIALPALITILYAIRGVVPKDT